MNTRINQNDWKLIYRYLSSFRYQDGVSEVLDKIQQHIVEGDSEYVKVVRIAFISPQAENGPDEAHPKAVTDLRGDEDLLSEMAHLNCLPIREQPPRFDLRMPEHPDDFDAVIDLLEALHHQGRVRYIR